MTPINQAQSKFDDSVSHFDDEIKHVRAGRPTPDMFANIKVEAYGAQSTLESVGTINVVDATLVTIQPWDKSLISAIEKAIQASNTGYNPQIDGDLIRIPIPALTQEKREEFVKKIKEMAENAKISIRMARKDVMDWLANEKKEGNMSEDDEKGEEKRLQAMVDKANEKIDELAKQKEESLMNV